MDPLLDGSSRGLIVASEQASLALWSEDKKKEFVGTLQQRVVAGRYILWLTGNLILEAACHRHYINYKHVEKAKSDISSAAEPRHDRYDTSRYDPHPTFGGRSQEELSKIATERANLILKELPSVRKAMEILDPDVAKKMDKVKRLTEEGMALKEQLEAPEFTETLKLSQVDQNMTIGTFRKMLEDREDRREVLLKKLNKIGKEASELQDTINIAIFRGVPGLDEAVVNVARKHYERAIALGETYRRMSEKVLYGDSEEAVRILSTFEQDEVTVSDSVKAEFQGALEKLNLLKKKAAHGNAGRRK